MSKKTFHVESLREVQVLLHAFRPASRSSAIREILFLNSMPRWRAESENTDFLLEFVAVIHSPKRPEDATELARFRLPFGYEVLYSPRFFESSRPEFCEPPRRLPLDLLGGDCALPTRGPRPQPGFGAGATTIGATPEQRLLEGTESELLPRVATGMTFTFTPLPERESSDSGHSTAAEKSTTRSTPSTPRASPSTPAYRMTPPPRCHTTPLSTVEGTRSNEPTEDELTRWLQSIDLQSLPANFISEAETSLPLNARWVGNPFLCHARGGAPFGGAAASSPAAQEHHEDAGEWSDITESVQSVGGSTKRVRRRRRHRREH